MDGQFTNIEGKLKTLAKVNLICAYILAVACVIGGLAIGGVFFIVGIGAGAIWLLIGYIGSWSIYAFAEILESVKETNRTLKIGLKQDVMAEETREAEEKHAREEAERKAEEQRGEAERRAAQERNARVDAYWAAHTEEKQALLAKKAEAEQALAKMGGFSGEQKQKLQSLISSIDAELTKDRV